MSSVIPPSPLSYEGQTVVQYINKPFPPPSGFKSAPVPCYWTDTVSQDVYSHVGNGVWVSTGGNPGEVETLTGDSGGAVSPDSDQNINILGTSGQINVVGTPGSNTLTLSLAGGGTAVDSFTTNTSGPVAPNSSGAILVNASTSTYTNGATANTLKIEVQGTNHAVIVGQGSNVAAVGVAPSATSGVPLISQGASADPAYGTAVVAGGGTGATSFTAYSVLCGGTTATGAVQNVSGVGTTGQVLTSNGAAALPTWQTNTSNTFTVVTQVFTGSGTYTPTSGMDYCIVEILGGGAGGGGTSITGVGETCVSGGGGAGEYARGVFNAATIGISQAVTIGALGAGGTSGNPGSAGGNSSLGALISANGGSGGAIGGVAGASQANGGAGGTGGSGGNFRNNGQGGGYANSLVNVFAIPGSGGNTIYGAGGAGTLGVGGDGQSASGYGAGGAGAYNQASSAADTGGSGTAGIVIVTEYIS